MASVSVVALANSRWAGGGGGDNGGDGIIGKPGGCVFEVGYLVGNIYWFFRCGLVDGEKFNYP